MKNKVLKVLTTLTLCSLVGCQTNAMSEGELVPTVEAVSEEISPTQEVTPTSTMKPAETPELEVTMEATVTVEPTETPEVVEIVETAEMQGITESPEPIVTMEPTEIPESTETPKPTEIPEPTVTAKPTATPKPTEIPAPNIAIKEQVLIDNEHLLVKFVDVKKITARKLDGSTTTQVFIELDIEKRTGKDYFFGVEEVEINEVPCGANWMLRYVDGGTEEGILLENSSLDEMEITEYAEIFFNLDVYEEEVWLTEDDRVAACIYPYGEEKAKQYAWHISNLVTEQLFCFTENSDGTITIDGMSDKAQKEIQKGNLKKLEIPSEIKGMPVIKIGMGAFRVSLNEPYDKIEQVILPDSIIEIGSGAFGGCSGLTQIELPKNLEILGSGAFGSCTGLTQIEIPKNLKILGARAFSECTSLTMVELPASLQKMGEQVFNETAIKELTLPAGNLNIHYIYYDEEYYYFSVKAEDAYWWFSNIFLGMSKLEKIHVAEGNELYTSIDGVLYTKDVTELVKIPQAYDKPVELPDTVTDVILQAYDGCVKLEEISFPASVGITNDYCWTGMENRCPNLKKIIAAKGSYGETFAREHGIEFEER